MVQLTLLQGEDIKISGTLSAASEISDTLIERCTEKIGRDSVIGGFAISGSLHECHRRSSFIQLAERHWHLELAVDSQKQVAKITRAFVGTNNPRLEFDRVCSIVEEQLDLGMDFDT